jgi:hypothetical protein
VQRFVTGAGVGRFRAGARKIWPQNEAPMTKGASLPTRRLFCLFGVSYHAVSFVVESRPLCCAGRGWNHDAVASVPNANFRCGRATRSCRPVVRSWYDPTPMKFRSWGVLESPSTPTRDNCPRLSGLGEDETHFLTLFRSVKRFEKQEEEPCLSSQQCSNNITITHFIHCRTINRRGTNRGTPKREGRGLNHQEEKFAIVPAVG